MRTDTYVMTMEEAQREVLQMVINNLFDKEFLEAFLHKYGTYALKIQIEE